jgi:hypothetical protein
VPQRHSNAGNCKIKNAHLPAVSGRKLYRLDTPTIEDNNRLEFVAVSKVIRGQAVTCTVNTAVYSTVAILNEKRRAHEGNKLSLLSKAAATNI